MPPDVIKNVNEEDEHEIIIGEVNADNAESKAQEEEEVLLASTSSNISVARKETQENLK